MIAINIGPIGFKFQGDIEHIVKAAIGVVLLRNGLTIEQRIILNLINNSHEPMTQNQISHNAQWLDCHPEYEKDVVADRTETTNRQVRQVIRDLRIKHRIPILAGRKGYFIPKTKGQVDEYLLNLEREAKARAAASMETYRVMKESLNVHSDMFERMGQ